MYDIIVIGGGTAGMTAALYGLRAGKSVVLLEGETFGGQIAASPRVDNYPGLPQISGGAFASALLDQVLDLGAETEFTRARKAEKQNGAFAVLTQDGQTLQGKSLVLATGVKHRRLGLPREEELTGEGVSYCAVCDGAFFKGRQTAVVGGGNTALEDALFLSAYCSRVFVIHRRESFRAEPGLVEALRQKPNVEWLLNQQVTALRGDACLQGVELQNTRDGSRQSLTLDGLFVAVGQVADNSAFACLVDLDEEGYIVAGEDCKTSQQGVFAAGDCRTKAVRQLTTAAADGAVAGLAAAQFASK